MRQRIFEIVSRVLGVPVEQITEDSSPSAIPQWDSLRHMHLLLSLEEELGVRFGEQEMVEMMSVARIMQVVRERMRT